MAPVISNPEVRWAQRSNAKEEEKNIIFLTINTPDVVKPEVKLTETNLKIDGITADKKKEYKLDLDFYDEIDVKNSKESRNDRAIYFILRKKTAKEEFWPRLTKEKKKLHYIGTDFDRWVDEDEQEEKAASDDAGFPGGGLPGGLDFSSLGGGAGAGGLGDLSALGGLGGLGGAGGPGGFDFSSLAAGAGAGAGADIEDDHEHDHHDHAHDHDHDHAHDKTEEEEVSSKAKITEEAK